MYVCVCTYVFVCLLVFQMEVREVKECTIYSEIMLRQESDRLRVKVGSIGEHKQV